MFGWAEIFFLFRNEFSIHRFFLGGGGGNFHGLNLASDFMELNASIDDFFNLELRIWIYIFIIVVTEKVSSSGCLTEGNPLMLIQLWIDSWDFVPEWIHLFNAHSPNHEIKWQMAIIVEARGQWFARFESQSKVSLFFSLFVVSKDTVRWVNISRGFNYKLQTTFYICISMMATVINRMIGAFDRNAIMLLLYQVFRFAEIIWFECDHEVRFYRFNC